MIQQIFISDENKRRFVKFREKQRETTQLTFSQDIMKESNTQALKLKTSIIGGSFPLPIYY